MYRRGYPTLLLLGTVLCCNAPLSAQSLPEASAPSALSDPMRPPSVTATPPPGDRDGARVSERGYRLSAIRITPERRTATINGTTVAVGERLGNARVSAIHASHVTLLQGGKTVTISLLPLSVKKPVEAPRP
ncbi:MAG: hypothetical protein OQL08_00435 [Gammaproteobacteria bacterium]|nr:hypothetical protein [Gammaproteobacteria bacterium]